MNTQAAEVLDETETDAVVADDGIVEPTVEAMLEMESPAVAGDDVAGDGMADPDEPDDEADGAPEPDARAEADDAARLAPVLEGLLFAAGTPVPVARLVEALDGPDRKQVMRALDLLDAKLADDGRGLRLMRVAGGYQLRTLAEHGPWIRRLLGGKPPRLSRALMETLAIIAYRQPCTRPEIEAIRGVDVDGVLSTLLERRLVRIVGRKEAPGRPILYGTTKDFLEVFGLPDLEALPPLKDLGELAAALNAEREIAAEEATLEGAPEPAADAPEATAETPDDTTTGDPDGAPSGNDDDTEH
jgi:segregation and condensation protein B